eukprot:CCRYP_019906-RA/>CCRYP_019906-RA protein AED:0.37 eAED:0.37 QI:0/0/0/1/0/0/2/0/95
MVALSCNVARKLTPTAFRFCCWRRQMQLLYEVATPTARNAGRQDFISTPGARFMTMDISNFYLMTPLLRPKYIRIKLSDLPGEIICEYKLTDKGQ